MNSTNENVIEMTEEPKVMFRLFNKLGYEWNTYNVDDVQVEFSIRPMSHPERARFRNAEQEVRKARDAKGAMKRAGYTKEDLYPKKKKLTKKEQEDVSEKWESVMNNITTDLDAESRFLEEIQRVTVACVEEIKIGDYKKAFDDSLYTEMKDDSLRMWLIQTIESASNLTPEERAGL